MKTRPVRRRQIATAPDAVAVQMSGVTKLNRYPDVFAAARDLCAASGVQCPAILSYGSSSGEEAHSLSTRYFEGSPILGLDVSDELLAKARATYGANPLLRFEKSGEYAAAPQSFDLIFAMSVLCRWPETRRMDNIARLFPFAAFEAQTTYLDSLLKPGGLMVIYNASYSFLHARASRHYDLIAHPGVASAGFVKRFAKDGWYDANMPLTDCLYRKQPEDEWIGERGLVIRDRALGKVALIERDIALDITPRPTALPDDREQRRQRRARRIHSPS